MNREPVNTRTNVVLNGHFESYRYWEIVNGGNSDLKEDTWEGQPITFMSLWKGSGIGQTVPAPARRSAGALYRLSFLYDNRHAEPGIFILRRRATEDKLEILLAPRGNEVSDNQTRALSLTPVTALIDFDVDHDDLFEFEIRSSTQSSTFNSLIIARIDFHLELDPLVLAGIVNDGQNHAPTEEPRLYLCHGATGDKRHQISFQPVPQSPWAGTEALLWSQDNPQEMIVVSPEWGENQPIEGVWAADCPVPTNDETLSFNLSIYSKYHAETYPIAVSLGHHRLLVETRLDPAYEPVVEYGQSVKLGVQVKSYYLDLAMRDYPVTWMLGDEVLSVGATDDGGYAQFEFMPLTEGSLRVEARVDSPFYAPGNIGHTFTVKAHATDPLKTVQVKFPGMEPALWGEKTGYPDRGASYRLEVSFAADSPLLNTEVWLAWEGKDPDELGVTVAPAFLQPVRVDGTQLSWTLRCEDLVDGHFNLRLASANLLAPTVVNLMSLARHSLKIGGVREANRRPVVDEGDYVWCMLQVMTLSSLPVAGVPVEWDTSGGVQRTFTGVNGWASVIDRPTAQGDYTLIARVNPREGGQQLGHDFAIRTLPTSAWKTARFTLGDVAIDRVGAGAVCRMGQQSVFRLLVEPGSPLIGKEVSLRWQDPASADSVVIADMETPTPLTADGAQWSVEALVAETSGVFDLQVISTGMEALDLAFRVLPEDLSAEVELIFDQAQKNWDTDTRLYPCIGAVHDLTVQPLHELSGLHGLLLQTSVGPDLPSGWMITPPLSETPGMTAGGVRYSCDFTGANTAAQRNWTVSIQGAGTLTQPQPFELNLGHNKVVLGTPYEVATDPVVSNGESARLALQYLSAFTGEPANDVSVTWDDGDDSLSGADGIAQRDYRPLTAGSHTMEAVVRNPYDATQVEHRFEVFAYQEDPWLELKVKTASGVEQPWGEQTFFPRRSDRFDLELCAPQGSPLLDQSLALGLGGVHELDMAMQFGPVGLGIPRPLSNDGLPVSLSAGDRTDAAFYLQLSASRLLERSPLNAFSLGSHVPVDVTASTHQDTVVDWGETLFYEVALTNALSGQPARNVEVSWESTDEAIEPQVTVTNFYGIARFSFVATVSGSGTVTARAMGRTETEVVEFDYLVHEACEIQSLTSDKLEGYPGEEVIAEVMVVSAASGEPVAGVRVHWFIRGVGLEAAVTDTQGKAQIAFELPARIGSYALSASVRGESGLDSAWLAIKVLGTQNSWKQEFTLWLNDAPVIGEDGVNRGVSLVHDTTSILELRVKKDSSLINATNVKLQGESGPLVTYDPGFYVARPVTTVPMSWTIVTQNGAYGTFLLELHSPDLPALELRSSVVDKL
ncbi:hypothetical protein [Pseudomonas brassicacearum]|uniref:hypothetical protein n=1 Tax=Pseudomonas brassicacearum TaxID=930166 RepID=UPI001D8DCAE7|nr:hypothetical protein [Pseudomonas brassicacearum]CAH0255009.1 hypothetical protein SRABI06_03240 [Pseudomonas brassicacearum]